MGVQGGGTIFCKKSDKNGWFSKSFPQELFWKGESKRDRVAAHTKMRESSLSLFPLITHSWSWVILNLIRCQTHLVLATHVVRTPSSTPPIYEGYVYVGSHNLTPSAWGSLQHPKYGEPQLAINNHELGVLVPSKLSPSPPLYPTLRFELFVILKSGVPLHEQFVRIRNPSLKRKRVKWSRTNDL